MPKAENHRNENRRLHRYSDRPADDAGSAAEWVASEGVTSETCPGVCCAGRATRTGWGGTDGAALPAHRLDEDRHHLSAAGVACECRRLGRPGHLDAF